MKLLKRLGNYRFTLLTALCIAVGMLVTVPDAVQQVPLFPGADKVVHFLAFGFLSAIWWLERCRKAGYARAPLARLRTPAIMTAAFGGVMEILQGLLTNSRMADWADWAADVAGAALVPVMLWPLVNICMNSGQIRMVEITRSENIPDVLKKLYHNAFPPDERRPWDSLANAVSESGHPLHYYVITYEAQPAGFITWWTLLPGVRYVEHFAISPEFRSKGLGGKVITEFVNGGKGCVALEVEPPGSSEMAERRIEFYKRYGFRVLGDVEYIQPPYSPELSPLPLLIMVAGECDYTGTEIAEALCRVVYGVEDNDYAPAD